MLQYIPIVDITRRFVDLRMQVRNSTAWEDFSLYDRQYVFLGLGNSFEELLSSRSASFPSSEVTETTTVVAAGHDVSGSSAPDGENAMGLPPVGVSSVVGEYIYLEDYVEPGRYARCEQAFFSARFCMFYASSSIADGGCRYFC